MRARLVVWLILTTVVGALAHGSTILTYTDRPTFNSAVGATTTETFGSNTCFPLTAPLNNSSSYSCLPAGTILPGATYSAPIVPGNSFNIDAGGGFPTPFLDSLLLGRSVGSAPLTVTFNSPLSAVGFDTNNLMGSAFSIQFNFLSGSSTLNETLSSGSLVFFGFKGSAADIVSVVINGNSSSFGFGVDNFSFGGGSTSSVPEPGPFLPVTGALLWLYWFQRRRSRSADPPRV
jgi:hypothetical protein